MSQLGDFINRHNDPKDDFFFGKHSIRVILYAKELYGIDANDNEDNTNKISGDYSTNEDVDTNDATDDVAEDIPFSVSSCEFEIDAADDTIDDEDADDDANDDANDDKGEYLMMDEETDELITRHVDSDDNFFLTPTAGEPKEFDDEIADGDANVDADDVP